MIGETGIDPVMGPAAGLAIGAFVRLGARCMAGYFAAALVMGLALGLGPMPATLSAIAKLAGPGLVVLVMGRSLRERSGTTRRRSMRLLITTCLAMSLPALGGSVGLVALGLAGREPSGRGRLA